MANVAYADIEKRGTILGDVKYSMPDWFKNSFLDIQEGAEKAGAQNRHVILFFHRDERPYCERML